MTEKKGIDFEHLTFIDESQVPAKAKRYTLYRELLKHIKKGKALVISEDQANIETTRAGVRRLQEKGEFKKIQMVQRMQPDGKRELYIINPSEEETEKKYRKVKYERVPPEERQQRMEQTEKTS